MKKLFSLFNYEACNDRVSPIIQRVITDSLYPGISIPNVPRLTQDVVADVVDYIEELVRTHGQASGRAKLIISDAYTSFDTLDSAGIFREEWYSLFSLAMRNIVEDELRRCGIGKTDSHFVDDGEETSLMPLAAIKELMEEGKTV